MTDLFTAEFDHFHTARGVTANQLAFVESLREQYDSAKAEVARIEGTECKRTAWGRLPETFEEASEAITKGKVAVAEMRAKRNALREDKPEPTEGVYVVKVHATDGEHGVDGILYLVRRGKESGRLYASTWDGERWEYTPNGMRDVIDYGRPATLDEAKTFGRATGQCCQCGRTLTNPKSVEAGIGPICAGRF